MHISDTLFDETRNLGLLDRGVRISIGAVAILSIMASPRTGILGWLALIPLFAVYPIMTGLIAYDPFYAWIGINTSSASVFSEEHLKRMVTTVTAEDTPPTINPDKEKSKVAKQPRNAA